MTEPLVRASQFITDIKKSTGKQVVKGIVYKPYELDSDGDWMAPEDIEKAAYQFMKENKLTNIDSEHDCHTVGAYVCESYIAKAQDPDGYPEGSWVVAVKIEDPVVWAAVEAGDYTGFSMWGQAYALDNVEPPTLE